MHSTKRFKKDRKDKQRGKEKILIKELMSMRIISFTSEDNQMLPIKDLNENCLLMFIKFINNFILSKFHVQII